MRITLLTLLFGLCLSNTLLHGQSEAPSSEEDTIRELLLRHASDLAKGDVNAVVADYVQKPDVTLINEGHYFVGRDAIRKRLTSQLGAIGKMKGNDLSMNFEIEYPTIVVLAPNMAIATYHGQMQMIAANAVLEVRISGSKIVNKTSNGWKIFRATDTVNVNDLQNLSGAIRKMLEAKTSRNRLE